MGSPSAVTGSGMWEGPATVCEACPLGDGRGWESLCGVTGCQGKDMTGRRVHWESQMTIVRLDTTGSISVRHLE